MGSYNVNNLFKSMTFFFIKKFFVSIVGQVNANIFLVVIFQKTYLSKLSFGKPDILNIILVLNELILY